VRTSSVWIWATTIQKTEQATGAVLRFSHGRWCIQNERGFNERVNLWHADRVYKHTSNAMVVFWLMIQLIVNLFHAFINRGLKGLRRVGRTEKCFADLISAQSHLLIGRTRPSAPS